MKLKLGILCALLLAGANAMACYTVYDASGRVVYRGVQSPVDMSLPLHQALQQGPFPSGASLVFDQTATCTPVSIAQVARPTGPNVPVNTIRLERSGRQISPSSSAPLLTDRQTAQRAHLPYTQVSGDIVMVPAAAAARLDLPTFTVIPADSSVARASSVDTRAMGAGPARDARSDVVITEMRDPPVTLIQRGSNVSVQR